METERAHQEKSNKLKRHQRKKKRSKKRNYEENEFGMKYQKEDRNSFSNSLKIFFKFLRDLKHTNPQLIGSIISNNRLEYSTS